RAGPDAVGIRERIALHGGFDAVDDRVDAVAALLREQPRRIAVPAAVRRAVAHGYGRAGAAQAPAVDLVDRVRGRAGPLDGHPGVHAEVAAPAHGARGVDLNDRAGMRLGR